MTPEARSIGSFSERFTRQARERAIADERARMEQMRLIEDEAKQQQAKSRRLPLIDNGLKDVADLARPTYPASSGGASTSSANSRLPAFAAASGSTGRVDTFDPSKAPAFLDDVARKYGIDPGAFKQMAWIESRFDPNARANSSSAGGLFQFTDDTAKAYGLKDKFDPVANAEAAARLWNDNRARLAKTIGREPTAGELYLAHQQGLGGAISLLRNPNASAESVLGRDAFRNNGGKPGMSAGDFAHQWTGRFDAIPATTPKSRANQDAGMGGAPQRYAATTTSLSDAGNDVRNPSTDSGATPASLRSLTTPAAPSPVATTPADAPQRLPDGREDMSSRYNTALTPEQEQQFQSWAKANGREQDSADYDMRGAWLSGAGQADNGHFPDTFKKPNHPTFSDQSKYNGVDGYRGGTWGGAENAPTFTPSDTNLKNLPAQELQKYFNKVEPNARIVTPKPRSLAEAMPLPDYQSPQMEPDGPPMQRQPAGPPMARDPSGPPMPRGVEGPPMPLGQERPYIPADVPTPPTRPTSFASAAPTPPPPPTRPAAFDAPAQPAAQPQPATPQQWDLLYGYEKRPEGKSVIDDRLLDPAKNAFSGALKTIHDLFNGAQ